MQSDVTWAFRLVTYVTTDAGAGHGPRLVDSELFPESPSCRAFANSTADALPARPPPLAPLTAATANFHTFVGSRASARCRAAVMARSLVTALTGFVPWLCCCVHYLLHRMLHTVPASHGLPPSASL